MSAAFRGTVAESLGWNWPPENWVGRGETVRKIRTALEASGIEFIERTGQGKASDFVSPDTQDESSAGV